MLIVALFLPLLALLAQVISAAPATTTTSTCKAQVKTPHQGTFQGNCLEHVEEYRGIPYAQPPTGERRFKKTVPLDHYTSHKLRNATVAGPVCRQPNTSYSQVYYNLNEDCLFLNVYKPREIKSPLPVMVWIHGGAFLQGSGSDDQFNATNFLKRSMELHKPVIYVSMNYRLGAFGFLGGKAIAAAVEKGDAALNPAYYDQREALHWVQRNIASFGGDPKKVTLFGESAGANSVGNQMLANEGDVQGLFRAAIMESGNPSVSRRFPADNEYPQGRYEVFAQTAGCDITASNEAQIACLRKAPSDALNDANSAAAVNQQAPFVPLQDPFFVNGLPSAQFKRGAFPTIPFITGDNVDEGTIFSSPTNITTDEEFADAILTTYGPAIKPLIPQIEKLWPNVPAKGSPYLPFYFGDSPDDTYYGPGNQYKRLSSFGGDLLFECGRRQQLLAAVKQHKAKAWSYRFAQPLPLSILAPGSVNNLSAIGVNHAIDINFAYNNPPLAGAQISQVPQPLRFYTTDKKLKEVARIMSSAWINFAHDLNPNGQNVPYWPEYYGAEVDKYGAGTNLYLQGGNVSLKQDSYQWKQTSFLLDHPTNFFI